MLYQLHAMKPGDESTSVFLLQSSEVKTPQDMKDFFALCRDAFDRLRPEGEWVPMVCAEGYHRFVLEAVPQTQPPQSS